MQTLLDNLRIYHQSVYHVQVQIQDTIDSQEALRNRRDAYWQSHPEYAQTTGCEATSIGFITSTIT